VRVLELRSLQVVALKVGAVEHDVLETGALQIEPELPSAPSVLPSGLLPAGRPAVNSVIVPAGVICAIAGGLPRSVNRRLPSAPAVIAFGMLPASRPSADSVIVRPIAFVVPRSVNQTFPSGPPVILYGSLPARRPPPNSVIVPSGATHPIAAVVPWSVNQTLPSAPVVIPPTPTEPPLTLPPGTLPGFSPAVSSVIDPSGVIRATAGVLPRSANQRW